MAYEDFTLILPTLNEEKTIGKLLNYVLKKYKKIHVLVVDDGSRDSTRETVLKISRKNKRIRLLDRSALKLQRGLTASVVDGIRRSGTKYAIVMDADMQHPPELIENLARFLQHSCDLAVACRDDVEKWSAGRKIISKIFAYFGMAALFVQRKQRCRDILSGYFGVKRDFFMSVYQSNAKRFVLEGYKVLYDFLKCIDSGSIRVCEAPYVFMSRRWGSSKAGFAQGAALLKSFFS